MEREQQKLCIWDLLDLTVCIFGVGGTGSGLYSFAIIILSSFLSSVNQNPEGVVGTPGFIFKKTQLYLICTQHFSHCLLYFFLCQLHVQVLHCPLISLTVCSIAFMIKKFSHPEVNWLLIYILFLLLQFYVSHLMEFKACYPKVQYLGTLNTSS